MKNKHLLIRLFIILTITYNPKTLKVYPGQASFNDHCGNDVTKVGYTRRFSMQTKTKCKNNINKIKGSQH